MPLLLVTITGHDKPGLTSSIMEVLGNYEAGLLDIGQAVIHKALNLGVLVSIKENESQLRQDLHRLGIELGLEISLASVTEGDYADWVGLQGQGRIILTLLARRISAIQIARISSIVFVHGLNIDTISRLSGRVSLNNRSDTGKACIEFSLKGSPLDIGAFRSELMSVSNEMDVDIAVQEDNLFRRNRRLAVFDMDSTLIDTEVIDELAIKAGVGKEVMEITHSAMMGEIDFKESLRRRVRAISGLEEKVLAEIAANLPLMEGAEHLFGTLKKLGYKTAILSGGFTYFAQSLQKRLGIDYVYANELEISDGRLTGGVIEPIVDADRKAELVQFLADKENISLQQVVAVGDGANDLAMLATAGMGIAFHAKPVVKQQAGHAISKMGLDSILYLMGIRDRDAE